MRSAPQFGPELSSIIFSHVTALSHADCFHKYYIWNSTLALFQKELLSVLVTCSVKHYVDETFGLSPNDLKCVLHHLFKISMYEKHLFGILHF